MDQVARARKGLLVYFAVLLPLTAVVELRMLRAGGSIDDHPWLVVALMWTPAFASLVVRLVLREGFADISLRLGSRKAWAYLIAWLFPVAVCLLAYGAAWTTGLAKLVVPDAAAANPVAQFAIRLLTQMTLGVLVASLFAAGEEIGWRGYMLTRLIDARVPRPVLVSALVWAAWHSPLILSGQYASGGNPVLSTVVFFVNVCALTYLFSRLRFETGSVWPAVLAHGAWNAVIQGAFDRWSELPNRWIGESGILTAVFTLGLVFLLVRGRWAVRRVPRDEPQDVAALAAW
ncbi:MAG: type II CAAX prenyl endopeptidase Rce1 family protein [Myxococcales bacterium]|jgi:membrane protease YdiL (CAAX protease family)